MSRPHFNEIDRLYRRILQRPVDPSGYETYSRLMAKGELAPDDLAKILRESEEFQLLIHQRTPAARFEISSKLHVANRPREEPPAAPRQPRQGVVAATIASKRYIANARVTAESFRQHNPDVPFVLLLTDELDGYIDPQEEPFEILTLGALQIPDLSSFTFWYTELEASYAALPFLLEHLLAAGFERVVFLKQETLVLGALDDLVQELEQHCFFVTPHLLEPLAAGDPAEGELDILRAGVFNGGILGISDAPEARQFLTWWQERSYSNCYRLVEDGLHFEQRWLDFLPSLVANPLIVRDPGVNVGHWNLLARDVRAAGPAFTAQGVPLRVFRFSGFDPQRPNRLTRYKDLESQDIGAAAEVLRTYSSKLIAAGYDEAQQWPYAFGVFDNGVTVPDIVRRIYRELRADGADFGDPLRNAGAAGSFYQWLLQPASAGGSVSNLWYSVYSQQPSLQLRFPQVEDLASDEFAVWCERGGAGALGIPAALYPASAVRPRR